MITWIKRFTKAKGSLRWKIYYAFDYETDVRNRKFFVCGHVRAGQFAKINISGDIVPFKYYG